MKKFSAGEYVIGVVGPITPAVFLHHLNVAPDFIMPKGLGGTPLNQLCEELLIRGHQLHIFTLDYDVDREVVLNGEKLSITILPYRARPRSRALSLFNREIQYLKSAIKKSDVDFIHAHWTYEFAIAASAVGKPLLVTAHDAPVNVLKVAFDAYRVIRTAMAYYALTRPIDILAAVSPYVANHLRHWRFWMNDIAIVPNGMPESIFEGYDLVKARRLNIGNVVTFATILNGWTDLKNGRAALAAFSLVRKAYPNTRLLMFGHGHGTGEDAHKWAVDNKVVDGVEFIGSLAYQELQHAIRSSVDVLVHPSREEAHPMVLIESMAQGIPVIGGISSGAVPWTLDFGKAGILVDINSPNELAQAMIKLAQSSDIRIQLGESGHHLVRNRFAMQTVADSYEILYAQLMERKRN